MKRASRRSSVGAEPHAARLEPERGNPAHVAPRTAGLAQIERPPREPARQRGAPKARERRGGRQRGEGRGGEAARGFAGRTLHGAALPGYWTFIPLVTLITACMIATAMNATTSATPAIMIGSSAVVKISMFFASSRS